jgi:lipid II isoglutaminyl synthase (glutamine-hydrolysing)
MLFYQLLARFLTVCSKIFLNRPGGTWPGEIALFLNSRIGYWLRPYFRQIIFVIGTNGKTSTTAFLTSLLEQSGQTVVTNQSGANLSNGLVSSCLTQLPLFAKKNKATAVFEVDEYSLPEAERQFKADYVLILNLFRDQLDRYGEVDSISQKWQQSLKQNSKTKIIYLTADPSLEKLASSLPNQRQAYQIPESFLTKTAKIAGDYLYCPNCQQKLKYEKYYLGHLGVWHCPNCSFRINNQAFSFSEREVAKLKSLPDYLVINLQAVYLLARELGLPASIFWQASANWQPPFGRGEIYQAKNHQYVFYLGKNPASWSTALLDIKKKWQQGKAELVLGLNNRVPDGHDISWIWDALFTFADEKPTISVYGDRAYDLAVRLKINDTPSRQVFTDLKKLNTYLQKNKYNQTIILANYSALLEARRLILGRSLL